MLHILENAPESRKSRKRVGRGPGSTFGKTCGRGHKGQKSRSGAKSRIGFEGGQMPIHRRLPKRGFTNIFKIRFAIVNLGDIEKNTKIDKSGVIDLEKLVESGLIKNGKYPVKILGNGNITDPVTIEANKFSSSAKKKIVEIGGKATVIGK